MATKKKALKKSKLRHAEYYDFQKIQDKLYAESMDGKMFTKLVEIITLPENIKLAFLLIAKCAIEKFNSPKPIIPHFLKIINK